jgi:xanthine dehydrogenase small subunit
VRIVKLSKRFDSDISAVCGAFAITVRAGIVIEARIAFGGMAATPKRSAKCEAALIGEPWSEATTTAAAERVAEDFKPLTDVRGTASYRLEVAANLVRRLWREHETSAGPSLIALEAIDA